jgi:hypothetical protein
MRNSVMFDLSGQTIGYTPFYITTDTIAARKCG